MKVGTSFHSGHVLVLARRAYERAKKTSTESEVSIALSAAAFEGFINEAAFSARHYCTSPSATAFAEIIEEAEEAHLQPITKFRLGVFALSGRMPSRGEHLIQKLSTLMGLRNGLMHLKPDPVCTLDRAASQKVEELHQPKEVRHLLSEKVITIPKAGGFSWRKVVAVPETARWCMNASISGMKALAAAASPVDDLRQLMDFQLYDRTEQD